MLAKAPQSTNAAQGGSEPVTVTHENLALALRGLPFNVRFVVQTLVRLKLGALTLRLPDGRAFHFDAPLDGPSAELILHNWRMPRRTLLGGTIGAAESYMDGDWDSPDVTALLSLFGLNDEVGQDLTSPNWFNNLVETVRHWWNENTPDGSRRNIAAHYDLGNAFYSRWLDPSMTYSSAIYEKSESSLTQAQESKYRSLAERAGMREGHSVLEIGCGWGGFAEYAAKHVGCKVTGLTISREQFDFARERIFREGLTEKVDIRFQDYRDEKGQYDAVASIEMFEAVGEKYWPTYFERVSDCLKNGGRAGLQIITIAERHFEQYRRRPDFIQRYIFPGGMLPPPSKLLQLGKRAGLTQVAERVFPLDYARTLAEWRHSFIEKWEDIRTLGFDERFRRMWEFYLHYCEAGFRTGNIDVRQVFFTRS
ncbi:MAG: cyclopropane-fatty-acyl-phospholipid synthase family protein [Nitratireductor sp.]